MDRHVAIHLLCGLVQVRHPRSLRTFVREVYHKDAGPHIIRALAVLDFDKSGPDYRGAH